MLLVILVQMGQILIFEMVCLKVIWVQYVQCDVTNYTVLG